MTLQRHPRGGICWAHGRRDPSTVRCDRCRKPVCLSCLTSERHQEVCTVTAEREGKRRDRLQRTASRPRTPQRPRDTGPSPRVRAIVRVRAGGRCESCGAHGSQLHHRRARALGGSRRADTNSPSNLLLLCLSCHAEVESHREQALDTGLLLRQSQDPAAVPVQLVHRGVTVLLTPDGRYQEVETA